MAEKEIPEEAEETPVPTSEELSKDPEGFFGGMPIDLDRDAEGGILRDVLARHIKENLDLEIENQKARIDKLSTWEDQYSAVYEDTDFPFEGAAALSPPITMSSIDAVAVRVFDALWGKRLLWIVRAKQEGLEEIAENLERHLNWYQKHILKLRTRSFGPIMQGLKTGTGASKLVYERKARTVYRYATEDEENDENIHKYPIYGTSQRGVKIVEELFNGPNYYPVAREDLVVSSDATDIEDAYLVAFRFNLRKPQLEARARERGKGKNKKPPVYYPEAVEKVIAGEGAGADETKKRRAQSQKMELEKTKAAKPYELYDVYIRYDVDGDGEEDDIVVTFHRETSQILSAIYHPFFSGFRPICKVTPIPVEFRFDGRGMCEILESIQDEIDYFHCQRINRLIEINAPMVIIRAGAFPDDSFELAPGNTVVSDIAIADAIKFLPFPDIYPSTEREEDRLVALGEKVIGITPGVMGMSTAERPVFKETVALLQEANRKFANIIENVRLHFIEVAYKMLEMFAQYQPTLTYRDRSTGKIVEQTVNFPIDLIRQGFDIDLEASSETVNREVRREINLAVYNLMSDYMTKVAGMANLLVQPEVPKAMKDVIMEANRISVEVLRGILRDYEKSDAESLVLDLAKIDSIIESLNAPPPQPPPANAPPNPQGQGGGPPGGPGGGQPPMPPNPQRPPGGQGMPNE